MHRTMKRLLLYYSHSGNNRWLVQTLAKQVDADIEEIRETWPRPSLRIIWDMARDRRPAIHPLKVSPDRYDRVLLVAPVWDRGIAHPMKTALEGMAGRMPRYGFVTLCGFLREGQQEVLTSQLDELTGRAPEFVMQLCVADAMPEAERESQMAVTRRRVGDSDRPIYDPALREIASLLMQADPAAEQGLLQH